MGIEHIDDIHDPRLLPYRHVLDPQWLRQRGIFLAEGRLVVERLLSASSFRVQSLLVTDPALQSMKNTLQPCREDIPVYVVSKAAMAETSGVRFHQGCVAVGERKAELSVDGLLSRLGGGSCLAILLEDITDPDNVGSIFRSAFAFGAYMVILSPGCASPLYRKAIRTSMAATLRLPFTTLEDWPDGLGRLRNARFKLLALSPNDFDMTMGELGEDHLLPDRLGLLFGNEGYGLSKAVLKYADLRVRIEMKSEADSLNVATTAAIVMHRLFETRSRR